MKLLEVALLEELNEKEVSPVLAEVPWLGRVRYIGQVEHDLRELVLELGVAHIEFFSEHVSTQLTNCSEVMRHISSEDRTYHLFPYFLVGLVIEFTYPVDFFRRSEKFEAGRYMMVLEDTLVVVADGGAVLDLREEDVVDARVLEVVAAGSDQVRHQFDVVKLAE